MKSVPDLSIYAVFIQFLWALSLPGLFCIAAEGNTLTVCPSCPLSRIGAAVDKAGAGDTIRIEEGVYAEHGIAIRKPLCLLGDGKAVIDGQNQGEILTIFADNTIIKGLRIRNMGVSFIKDRAAIRLVNCTGAVVEDNILTATFFGIYLQGADSCVIRNNRVIGKAGDEAQSGNAIHIWKAGNILVEQNYVTGHRDGIYFEFVDDSEIRNNVSEYNIRYGLHFMFSNGDLYQDNVFRDNGVGVAVMFSRRIRMIGNVFEHNWGGASYGILLKEISDGEMAFNRFEENTKGIYAEGANRLQIHHNDFLHNGWALDIKGNCMDNVIERNNFIANTFEVTTNSRHNLNTYAGNYWSHYRGADLNRDGTGDAPHRPVSLHSLIINRIPAAGILLHSFLIDALEYAERLAPSLIPEALVDRSPSMKPIADDPD